MNDCGPLVAACDVLCLRVFEVVGKRIVRSDRSRYRRMAGVRWDEAHTLWQADPEAVERALSDAWTALPDVVARYGCWAWDVPQLTLVLDRYVRDTVYAGLQHDPDDLAFRMGAR